MVKMSKTVRGVFQKWGQEGGEKRARLLPASRKKAIASKAARARWKTKSPFLKSVRLEQPRFDDPVYLEEILENARLREWKHLYHEVSEYPFGPTADALLKVLTAINIYGVTNLWKSILKNLQGAQ
jgi:hypothetical protein